jgi:hypothetical protein
MTAMIRPSRFLGVLGVLVAAGALLVVVAAKADGGRAEVVEPRQPVRPTSVIAQIEYCRTLVEMEENSATVASCARHAASILKEGMRVRRASPEQSAVFEEELELGAAKIAARLEALSRAPMRLDHDLLEVEDAIRALRLELSRIAAAEHVKLSLVSRGGVSLGNWQAGFLYSITEWAKTRRSRDASTSASEAAFSTVTGASAGAVNGLAAAIEGCRYPNLSAKDSLYYQVWTGLGLFGRHGWPGLFPGAEGGSTAVSLFTNDALEATLNKAESYIESGGQLPSCSVDFGFVATHLDPTRSPVHVRQDGDPILTTQKLKEKFSVRLEFSQPDSNGLSPEQPTVEVRNIGPPKALEGDQVYFAGLGHTREVPLQSLMQGVRASGAFPGAFPPVALAYTQYLPGPDRTVLRRKRLATFIDGGILDNTPVGLAVALDSWRGDSAGPESHLEGLIPKEPRTYIFLEPLVTSWIQGGSGWEESGPRERDLLKTYLAFVADLLATTTDAQLTNTAERFPFVRRESQDWTLPRLSVPERNMPITGEQFEHFMAFMERDFRVFDFYVGMADAYAYLEREECLLAPQGASCHASENLPRLDGALKEMNPNYKCIRAYYDSDESKVLKRITTDRLPQECERLAEVVCGAEAAPTSKRAVSTFLESRAILREGYSDRCMEPSIANHNFRALLAAMHNYKVWAQSDEYSESDQLDRFFDELSKGKLTERFIYLDTPTYLKKNRGYLSTREAKRAFRSLVQTGIERLASEQEDISEYALVLGGRLVADIALGKEYPERIVGLGVAQNGVELVFGQRLFRTAWRWDSTGRVFNFQQEDYGSGLDPFTSEFYLATQATRIFSPADFMDFEAGAGWAASQTIAYNSERPGHVAFRSGPRSYLALVILQRVYVALNVDYYPIKEVGSGYRDSAVDDWEFNLTAGWRFLF